jgi:hypothetical protein
VGWFLLIFSLVGLRLLNILLGVSVVDFQSWLDHEALVNPPWINQWLIHPWIRTVEGGARLEEVGCWGRPDSFLSLLDLLPGHHDVSDFSLSHVPAAITDTQQWI